MQPCDIFDDSDTLARELLAVIDLPLLNSSSKIRTSDVACSLALEHWHSARALLRAGRLPSALVVHRAQFEALVRSIWIAYAASDDHVSKLTSTLSLESEQAAKNMPQVERDVLSSVVGIENQDRQTLNFPGFAHGLSTAGRRPALEARWRPTVGNPAPCLLDHKTKDNIPFRSPIQRAGFPTWKLNGLPISRKSKPSMRASCCVAKSVLRQVVRNPVANHQNRRLPKQKRKTSSI